MSYSEKFERVRTSLIDYCKQRVIQNWDHMFDMWLNCEADLELGDGYQNKFKEEFSQYMNEDIEGQLWFAGKNVVFAIGAFISFKTDASLNEVVEFTEHFVDTQLNDFDNWCDEILLAMPDEEEHKDDNPS